MTDLITLDEYKARFSLTSTKEDEKLESIISGISGLIKTYCGRSFVDYVDTDKIEIVSVNTEATFIQLSEFPVISITKVEERASYADAYTELTEAAFEFYLDTEVDSIYKTNGAAGFVTWSTGPGSVRITYKAGYVNIPEDLKLVSYDLVNYYAKDEYKGTSTLGSASKKSPGTTTQQGNVSFPDHIKRVLDLYKNI